MRTFIFRKILHFLSRKKPGRAASIEIQILLNTTAKAFGVKGRRVWNLSPQAALRTYCLFTAACMRQGKADPERLYAESFRAGSMLRRITGFQSSRDIEELVFYLYKNIGIAMDGRIPGEVTVHSCYFSRFYLPGQCLVMSAADSGILSGIAGGGSLCFTERITEGNSCCRAVFGREKTSAS